MNLERSVKIFSTPYELAEKFARELVGMINDAAGKGTTVTVALSGGTTPELLFSLLGDHFSKSAAWENVHFFWGDERCVPADNRESNYGMTNLLFFRKIKIPFSNIHRIKGEEDPEPEASRYSREIVEFTRERDGMPEFDLVILGMGEDGHSASIFPGNLGLFHSDKICDIAKHPVNQQQRITITGNIINNADTVVFLVTGKKKAAIVEKIINKNDSAGSYPASYILPVNGCLKWYLDKEAGSLL